MAAEQLHIQATECVEVAVGILSRQRELQEAVKQLEVRCTSPRAVEAIVFGLCVCVCVSFVLLLLVAAAAAAAAAVFVVLLFCCLPSVCRGLQSCV